VALTDAGQRLLGYADKLLDLAEEARAAVAANDEPMGTLALSAPETLCTYRLPAVLHAFRRRYPTVRLTVRPCPVADLRRAVSEGTLDVAFVLEEPIHAQTLSVEPLVVEPLLILAPPGHPLAAEPVVDLADLDREPVLFTEVGCAYRVMFERALAAAGVYPTASLEFASVEAIKQFVMAGMGITILPSIAVRREVAESTLVPLHCPGVRFEVVSQMVWHKDKWLSPALRAFLSLSRQMLAA
jgi:DNA-binding transcriptional LysR family regulator